MGGGVLVIFWGIAKDFLKLLLAALISFVLTGLLTDDSGEKVPYVLFLPIAFVVLYLFYLLPYFEKIFISPFRREDIKSRTVSALKTSYYMLKYLACRRKVPSFKFRIGIWLAVKGHFRGPTHLKVFRFFPPGSYDNEELDWELSINEFVTGWCYRHGEARTVDVSTTDWEKELKGCTYDQLKAAHKNLKGTRFVHCKPFLSKKNQVIGVLTLSSKSDLVVSGKEQESGEPLIHSPRFTTDIILVLRYAAELMKYVFAGDERGSRKYNQQAEDLEASEVSERSDDS